MGDQVCGGKGNGLGINTDTPITMEPLDSVSNLENGGEFVAQTTSCGDSHGVEEIDLPLLDDPKAFHIFLQMAYHLDSTYTPVRLEVLCPLHEPDSMRIVIQVFKLAAEYDVHGVKHRVLSWLLKASMPAQPESHARTATYPW